MSKKAAAAFLKTHNDFLLIAHVSPDGDTLGSCLCLYQALLQLDKRVQLACEEPVPPLYAFLPHADTVKLPSAVGPFSAIVFLDCADLARAGDLAPLLGTAQHSLCIDHHQTNPGFAQVNWIARVSSTGEMIFSLLEAMDIPVTPDMAACLYTAISTDTGNFSYANVSPDTFRIAARLLERGLDLPELNRRLFRCVLKKKTRLVGVVINNLEFLADGRFALSTVSRTELKRWDATGEDCEGLIDHLRDIQGVEVSCLLRESIDGQIRVSLRSLRHLDVSRIAADLGGGGHRRAAGITLPGPMEQAKARMTEAISQWM